MNPTRFLEKYAVRRFYHFTDERNLPSIRDQGGLLSRQELAARRILPVAPAGTAWMVAEGRDAGLDAYVHLCLLAEHPTEAEARQQQRVVHTRFVGVEPRILLAEGGCFCADPPGPRARLLRDGHARSQREQEGERSHRC